jgi:hypothetical protein
MQPTSPVLTEKFVLNEVVFAKDQAEYDDLPTIRNSKGMVLSRWKPTDDEREAIAKGADVLLTVWTFNQPLQPLLMEVPVCGHDVAAIVQRMELA